MSVVIHYCGCLQSFVVNIDHRNDISWGSYFDKYSTVSNSVYLEADTSTFIALASFMALPFLSLPLITAGFSH